VPLAVALLNVSNPEMGPMDMLSRLSHDSDEAVAQNAILALGGLLCPPSCASTQHCTGATSTPAVTTPEPQQLAPSPRRPESFAGQLSPQEWSVAGSSEMYTAACGSEHLCSGQHQPAEHQSLTFMLCFASPANLPRTGLEQSGTYDQEGCPKSGDLYQINIPCAQG